MLSVIIPLFNEEANIEACIKCVDSTLARKLITYEIICVDDGSTDRSLSIVKELSATYPIRYYHFSRNFGKEAAIRCGLNECLGDCAVIYDADMQFPSSLLVEMYERWQEGYEICEGVKETRQKEGFIHKCGAKLFYHFMKKFGGVDLHNKTDFKLIDRKVIEALKEMDSAFFFYRGLSSWMGYRTYTLNFKVEERKEGSSKWSFKKLFAYALANITGFTTLPMQFVTMLGLAFLIFAVVMIIDTLVNYFNGVALGGFTTVIILLLIIGSIMMLSLGIMGYYLAKIYQEVLRRPTYLVSERSDKQ